MATEEKVGEEKEEEIVGEENQAEPEDDMFFGEEDKPGEDLADAEDLLSDEQISETDSGEEQEEEGVGDEDVKDLLDDDEDLPSESEAVEETSEVVEAGGSKDESEDSVADEEEPEEATVEDSSSDEREELPPLEEGELDESEEATASGAEDAGDAVEELTGEGSAPDAESALPDPPLDQTPTTQAAASQGAGTELLLHFHHEVRVEVARTHLSGEEITKITNGSIIVLDKVAGEPVEIVLDDKVIAQGEVVLINKDKLGVRIIGIVHN